MEIIKILNNNAVLVTENGEEKIVMGRGLAFGLKVSDSVDDMKVEKIYELKNAYSDHLIDNIPQEILTVSDQIVTKAKAKLTSPISDVLFITIADHLNGAIARKNEGVQIKNFLLWDVKNFFPKEFEIGKFGIEQVAQIMKVQLPEDEAGFLALHIVSAESNNESSTAENLIKLMEEILTVIKYSLKINLDEENIYFQRFKTHLKFFSERILALKQEKSMDNDPDMFDMVKRKYPESYKTTQKVCEFIKNQYAYEVSQDEQFYLMIHMTRIINVSQ